VAGGGVHGTRGIGEVIVEGTAGRGKVLLLARAHALKLADERKRDKVFEYR